MTDEGNPHQPKPIRWFILLLYVICNFTQFLQYNMIPDTILSKFYEVTEREITWTYYVIMAFSSPLALPAATLLDKISLRWTVILGSTGTALGSLIKLFSATPGGFYVTMVGQTVLAISLLFMVSVPQKMSRTWFGEREVSLACCIGYSGLPLSMVMAYFLPSMLISNHEDPKEIRKYLFNMFIYFAVASSVVAVLVVFSRIGMTMVISGMAASIAYGIILDKTKKFKLVFMVAYCMSVVSMATFTCLLVYCNTVWVIYIGAVFIGIFLCGFTAVSYDVATELTYPESEYIIVTILNIVSWLVTYSTTHTFRYINTNFDYYWGNIGFVVTLFFGAICTLPIKFELKRNEAISNYKKFDEFSTSLENILS